ncbi:hypothetical protein CPB83DRAFT_848538 [Crepidotus variabilis]|uniref:Yippee domain-containing protein n=1 Tax=Crepidotus variabilis TaxID=179855 RepID=A0A9P6EM50_9AGAR|nr:hypothetical protein CPB83DRAFT_848538 [Crepidotus variabilis]
MANEYSSLYRPQRESTSPRRLPLPPTSIESRRISRPLPKIPPAKITRGLVCKQCGTCITSHNAIFPPSSMPPGSRGFKGFSGKACLFKETYNVQLSKANVQLMTTGAHTMQEMTCTGCLSYVGWKIVRAHEKSESWKDGQFLVELESLYFQPEASFPIDISSPYPRRTSSDSEYSP